MSRRSLTFCWDEQAGRMRLRNGSLRLKARDRVALEGQLVGQYESLLAHLERDDSELTVAFNGDVLQAKRVQGFRVRYRRDSRGRCPALILEPLSARKGEPPASPSANSRAASRNRSARDVARASPRRSGAAAASRELAVRSDVPWLAGFVADVKRRFKDAQSVNNADRAAVGFTLAQLRDRCSERPEDLSIMLLAGYVSLGERMSGRVTPSEAHMYREAARVLDELCGREPPDATDSSPASSVVPPQETAGRLRRITRFLGRTLGIQDDDDWE